MSDPDVNLENTLIAQARSGDEQAFRLLVGMHERSVARIVIGMLGNVPQARDVGQEVFIRFYKNIGAFKGDSSLRTYLTRIAINLSLNELKSRKRSHLRITSDMRQGSDVTDQHEDPERRIRNEWVQKALASLDAEFRIVVVLRLMEGYSTREVAEMLNLPLGTVLSRLARGQQKLKLLLEPEK